MFGFLSVPAAWISVAELLQIREFSVFILSWPAPWDKGIFCPLYLCETHK
jgi:hypothetical protein